MKNYGELLKRFCGDDEMREWVNKPFQANGKAIGTDGRILVAAPLYDKSLPDYSDKVKSVYPVKCNCDVSMPTSELNSIIDKWPKIELFDIEHKECDACNGDGEVVFEFDYDRETYEVESDCPICDGEGQIEFEGKTPNGKFKLDAVDLIKVGGDYFNPNLIKHLLDIALFLQEKTIKLVRADKDLHPALFAIGEVEVLIMPMRQEPYQSARIELFQPQTSTP